MTPIDIEQERRITTILAHNRTENIGQDVWEQFVVPRYFDRHDFFGTMPCVIQGGRGCGKTMLLRFLSYRSQYSYSRVIENPSFEHIGIYWRADTAFIRQLDKRGAASELWLQSFSHYASLKVVAEIVDSVLFLNERFSLFDSESVCLTDLADYDDSFSCSIKELKERINKAKRSFEIAVCNPRLLEKIVLFPNRIIDDTVEALKREIPVLSDSTFHIFLDEYENLLSYQKTYVNTCLKHSEPPVIFKIACKRNGMPIIDTLGDETIQEKDDYIVHDIDIYTINNDYNVFAAEVLLNRISTVEKQDLLIALNDVNKLEDRRTNSYKTKILESAKAIFPGQNQAKMASEVFNSPSLRKKLLDMLKQGLAFKERQDLDPNIFFREEAKQASIVTTALLHRTSTKVEVLLEELENYINEKKGKYTDWIGTNFMGCYLNIIKRRRQENRFYTGFESFAALSRGNLRYFLELSRTAFSLGYSFNEGQFSIDESAQAMAAEKTSSALYNEIKSFKPYGHKLQVFAFRLGNLFSVYQSRLSQSEPEISHFSIEGGISSLSEETQTLLYACEKWGVLYRTPATKVKNIDSVDDFDWVLNPMYAPQFLISYRKRRKITISGQVLEFLYDDSKINFENYLRSIRDKMGSTEELDVSIEKTRQRDFFDV